MESESARMSSAAEARFRIDYPNSQPRAVKVIALDQASEQVIKRAAERTWQGATFFTSLKFDGAPRSGEGWSIKAWLSDLAGRTKALVEEVNAADLVVMVSSAGTARASRRRHRRSLRGAQGDDHGADHRQRAAIGRGGLADAGRAAAPCRHAGDRRRRRIHRGHAGGVAGLGEEERRE